MWDLDLYLAYFQIVMRDFLMQAARWMMPPPTPVPL
jgi:hypothetical protein